MIKASASGGSTASRVFFGLGLGAIYAAFQNENLFGAWPGTPEYRPDFGPDHVLKGASIKADATSEYLGVGYIIGPKTAGIIFSGGVFSWLVLMPLLYFFGKNCPLPFIPARCRLRRWGPANCGRPISGQWAPGLWRRRDSLPYSRRFRRLLVRCAPVSKNMRGTGSAESAAPLRTEHDLSMGFAVVGSIALIVLMFLFSDFKPVPGAQVGMLANLGAALLVVIFGFLFVTVSSRIVGLIGSSANPISGMTIATLMATSAIFLVNGWTAPAFGALAITIGGVVCIASAEAGDTSQDLKTGYLLGATPIKQRFAFLIGITVSTIAIGVTLNLMNQGLQEFQEAPRAWSMTASHPGVAVQQDPHGLMDQFTVKGANNTTTLHHKSEYWY